MISALPSQGPGKVTPIRDTSAQDRPVDPEPARRLRRYRWVAIGVGALVLTWVVVALVRNWLDAEASVPLERVRIAEVTRGAFVRDVSAQGTVVAAVSPTLVAAAPGTIHFLVQAGDGVKKEQVIATLDSPELLNELAREEATLSALEIAVQRQSIDTRRQLLANQQAVDLANVAIQAAQREQRRAQDSWDQQIISQRDYEKSRDDATAAQVNHTHATETAALQKESLNFELRARNLERDRQRLLVQDLRRRVADLEIKSPVEGAVGTLLVNERATVARSAPLLTVVDLSAFEVEFQVPESYADDLGLGMNAEVRYGSGKYAAKVSAVSPEVKQNQVTGRLKFSGEAPQGLRQNQRLTTRIVLEARDDALKVQRGPFLDSGAGRIAYVVRDGIAIRTPIETGASSIAEVEIVKGLAPGDRIVISNLNEFERAERVRLTD
jgi:HlyD family secretion protein